MGSDTKKETCKKEACSRFLPCRPQPAVELTLLQIPEVSGGLAARVPLAWHSDLLIPSSRSENRGFEELEAWLQEWHLPVGILLFSW